MRIAIVGGGAAGCFAAAEIARRRPEAEVVIYEAGDRLMAKLAITGGGRCNFTNTFEGVRSLSEAYPRGERLMKRALAEFSPEDAREWFRKAGVPGVEENDGCIFPCSQNALDVVDAIRKRMNAKVLLGRRVRSLDEIDADAIIVTSGGGATGMLEGVVPLVRCVPSLFSLKIDDTPLKSLMGITVPEASVALAGTKFRAGGILLITDWGVSGPAILKLSSYAARTLNESGYRGSLVINWTGWKEEQARGWIAEAARKAPKRLVRNLAPEGLSGRLWEHICSRAGLRAELTFAELGSKGASRLCATLCSDSYPISGRCPFKAEFVTCGGVDLSCVNPRTMECRTRPGLYFAGEVMDIDAITGGFNLQAAWSTAWIAAKAVSEL